MQEYELDIIPMKKLMGIGLDEFISQSYASVIVEAPQVEDLIDYEEMVRKNKLASQPWYGPIIYFLMNGVFHHTCILHPMEQFTYKLSSIP
jgi:hypothetical protein